MSLEIKQAAFESAKQDYLKAILESEDLTRLQKLKTITQFELWGTEYYTPNMFDDLIKDNNISIHDDYFKEHCDRYNTYYYVDYCNLISEEGEENEDFIVITERSSGREITLKGHELIDRMLDYAFEHETIGFQYDW